MTRAIIIAAGRLSLEVVVATGLICLALSFVSPHGRERLPSAVVLEASLP
jgi:hypothetical protein